MKFPIGIQDLRSIRECGFVNVDRMKRYFGIFSSR